MKAHLLFRDRDLDWRWIYHAAAAREAARAGRRHTSAKDFDPKAGLPWNAEALTADLSLDTLFDAMGRDDPWVREVARKVILSATEGDLDTIGYRQRILRDCLDHPEILRELFDITVEAMEKQRGAYLSVLGRYPDSVLRESIDQVTRFLVFLRRLRSIADHCADAFRSDGWTTFFRMLQENLSDDYLRGLEDHLESLKFRDGEVLSAGLGPANKADRYVLHRTPHRKWSFWAWFDEFVEERPAVFSFELHPRDEAGAQALNEIRNRGIAIAADALGQSADHVRDFFGMLRAELAFYIGCVNLRDWLRRKGEPTCLPSPAPLEERRLSCRGLHDVGLALTTDRPLVGNDVEADGRRLLIVTGPNTGGKSTFLRSLGLAQLMMQSGMFVGAQSFSASTCRGLLTHYKREEDAGMTSGKFDEEMVRISEIVDHVRPGALLLFNESFAATNEREGSEVAWQIMTALLDRNVRQVCVTHLYELAQRFFEQDQAETLFLRAGRDLGGERTFKLEEGAPSTTSYGEDLYRKVFKGSVAERRPSELESA